MQRVPTIIRHLEFFHVKKSCKIECCGNKTHQIIQNVILSRGLELKTFESLLKVFCEGQLSQASILYFTDGKNYVILRSHYISMGGEFHIRFPVCKIKNAGL